MRYPEFAERFKAACLKANMPKAQTALGDKLGVSGPMVHAYRNGEKLPGTDKLGFIAKKLHVTIDWLINGVETPGLSVSEQKLIDNYREASDTAKHYIESVAEREAQYVSPAAFEVTPDDIQRASEDTDIAGLLLDALDKLKFAHPENTDNYDEAEKQLNRFFTENKLKTTTTTDKRNFK